MQTRWESTVSRKDEGKNGKKCFLMFTPFVLNWECCKVRIKFMHFKDRSRNGYLSFSPLVESSVIASIWMRLLHSCLLKHFLYHRTATGLPKKKLRFTMIYIFQGHGLGLVCQAKEPQKQKGQITSSNDPF